MQPIFQLNLQTHWGGGEVYTHFLCQALAHLNRPHTLITHPKAAFWPTLPFDKHTKLHTLKPPSITELVATLPNNSFLITHGALNYEWVQRLKQNNTTLIGIAHMPLYGRNPNSFQGYDTVIAVSQYVLNSLIDYKISNPYPKPWYGVATLDHRNNNNHIINKQSIYSWDKRKFRDRVLSWIEPINNPFKSNQIYQKRTGLTLGLVSRITPIKQFPLMFDYLTPILKKHPSINLEIFGSGGYASIRDLKKALRPLEKQVRWWGQQSNVASVYQQLDFLLTGLPEKEALGLNIIEAQQLNIPTLGVKALPFTETIIDQKTGFLFTDPRQDQGQHFESIIKQLIVKRLMIPQPLDYPEHLAQFSFQSFTERVKESLLWWNL